MKMPCLALFIFLSLTPCLTAQDEKAPHVSVKELDDYVDAGNPVLIRIDIENPCSYDLALYNKPAEKFFLIECTSNGQPVPLTLYGQKFYDVKQEKRDVGEGARKILSKEKYSQEINVARLYDMSLPGEYLIKVTLHIQELRPTGKVRLNTGVHELHVEVLEHRQ